ncbi:MAG: hypothetical protein ACTS4V_00555 [Candidatus Hodgkinia cicadicola]
MKALGELLQLRFDRFSAPNWGKNRRSLIQREILNVETASAEINLTALAAKASVYYRKRPQAKRRWRA